MTRAKARIMRLPRREKYVLCWLLASLLLGVMLFGVASLQHGEASPVDISGQGSERVLVAQTAHTGSGASDAVCDNGKFTQWSTQMTLGTTPFAGAPTAPAMAVVVQHSIDGGSHWFTANTFTTVNATVTPAAQLVTNMSGIISDTPTAYGRCWRVAWTASGTGTITADFGVAQFRH
jgi:hypothetical protein